MESPINSIFKMPSKRNQAPDVPMVLSIMSRSFSTGATALSSMHMPVGHLSDESTRPKRNFLKTKAMLF